MFRNEAEAEFAYVRTLWPTWKPEDGLAGFWIKQLTQHDSPSDFRAAVEQHRAKSRYAQPNLAELKELLARKTPSTIQSEGPIHTGVYILCIDGPKAGLYQELLYPTDKQPPTSQAISRIAQDEAQKYATYWGGRCIVVEQASAMEMLRRKTELQVQSPPPPFSMRDIASQCDGQRRESSAVADDYGA